MHENRGRCLGAAVTQKKVLQLFYRGRFQTLVPRRENDPIASFRGPGLVPDRRAAAPVDPPAAPVDSPVDPVDVRRASRGRRRRRKTCKPQRLPK